jgi:hypothetical protein
MSFRFLRFLRLSRGTVSLFGASACAVAWFGASVDLAVGIGDQAAGWSRTLPSAAIRIARMIGA